MTAPYEHVIFDLDGTLIDSRDDLAAAVNHTLAALGLPALPSDTVVGYVGDGARALIERALGAAQADRIEAGLQHFTAYYGAHLLERTRPCPGIAPVIDELARRGVALSVLTNKPEGMSRAILAGLGMLSRFGGVVGGDSLPARKPDPAGLLHLAARTGTARERLLLVGDSPVDLNTARAGGCAFCGVAWGFAPARLAAAAPVRLIAQPEELLEMVRVGSAHQFE